jgi:hypothetical protein
MKTTLAVLALCVCATGALAAVPECRVIENANARLSCYDAVYPPKTEKSAVSERDPSRAAYKGSFQHRRRQHQRQAEEYLPRLLR